MATIHLQGIGKVLAEKASELAVNDRIMWNYGVISTVTKIEDVSPKFLRITERSKDGTETTRRLGKDRLVARMPAETR